MNSDLEIILSTTYKEQMISYLNSHPESFEEAVQLAIGNKQPYSWRSAWLLWSCMQKNDHRIQPYVQDMINALSEKKDGHQRELIKILLDMDLTEEQEGYLFDLCSSVWEKTHKNPSVRFTAFKFLVKMAKKHPDLINEITFLCQEHYLESLSPGVKRSLSRMIKGMAGN